MQKTYEFQGVEYLLGSADSLILACPKCGEEHFRDPENYFWSLVPENKAWLERGQKNYWGDPITPQMVEEIIAAEREACAKTCEAIQSKTVNWGPMAGYCAKQIRMRSNAPGNRRAAASSPGVRVDGPVGPRTQEK